MSEAKEKVKKKGLNPLIIVIAGLVLVIIGLAAYFLVIKKPATQTVSPYVATQNSTTQAQKVAEASWSAGDFLVNLANTDADRYMKSTIVLTYDSKDTAISKTMDDQKYAIRDAVIEVIRTKKSTDISTAKGIDILKTDIVKKVNGYLGSSKIINAYFSDVLIQ